MQNYSQYDEKWKDIIISKGVTISSGGCLVVSLSILHDITPDKMLTLLKHGNCFDEQGKLYCDRIAATLGYHYRKIDCSLSKEIPTIPCVAETNKYKKLGNPQHFFVWFGKDNMIIDPKGGIEKQNPYNIVSYRIFEKPTAV